MRKRKYSGGSAHARAGRGINSGERKKLYGMSDCLLHISSFAHVYKMECIEIQARNSNQNVYLLSPDNAKNYGIFIECDRCT